MRWMTSLTSGRFQPPLSLTEGNTVDFVFRLSNNGTLFTPPLTPVWIFGIKDADTPNGDFLIQVNSATASSGVFTFVVELASAELQAWLATATSQSYAAIQITDSANDIATAPLLCQIAPNQNDTGTTPTSANGTLNVTAGKTVTFPQSLTFPSALGTNGFQLSTDGAGALTWAASGALTDGDKGDITVSNSGAIFTIDNDVVGLSKLAHMTTNRVVGRTTAGTGTPELLTISGTGSVAMTNTPTLVTPVLGAATATSLNGAAFNTGTGTGSKYISFQGGQSYINLEGNAPGYGYIDTNGGYGGYISTAGSINDSGGGGYITTAGNGTARGGNIDTRPNGATAGGNINTSYGGDISTNNGGGAISTSSSGGSITTSNGGGSISTNGTGSIELGVTGTRTTFIGTATTNRYIDLPDASGAVLLDSNTATITNKSITATQLSGNIAVARIATALTTPGAIGGTTPSTGAFTTISGTSTLTLGVVSATAGTIVLRNASNVYTTTIVPSVVTANRQLNLPLITGTDTVAVLGLTQTFTGNKTFSGTVSCGSTLAVTSGTTLSGGLNLAPQYGQLLTTTSSLTDYQGSATLTLGSNGPSVYGPGPIAWFSFNDAAAGQVYFPVWGAPP